MELILIAGEKLPSSWMINTYALMALDLIELPLSFFFKYINTLTRFAKSGTLEPLPKSLQSRLQQQYFERVPAATAENRKQNQIPDPSLLFGTSSRTPASGMVVSQWFQTAVTTIRAGGCTIDDLIFMYRQAFKLSDGLGGGDLPAHFVDAWLNAVTNLFENEEIVSNLSSLSSKAVLGVAFGKYRDKMPSKFWTNFAKNSAILVPKFDEEQLIRTAHELTEMQKQLRMSHAFWDAFRERLAIFLGEKSEKLDLRAICILLTAFRNHDIRLFGSLKKLLVQRSFELLPLSNDAFELCNLINLFERLSVRTDTLFTVEIRKHARNFHCNTFSCVGCVVEARV